MRKEVRVKASSVEEAIEKGALQLGINTNSCLYEVLEPPKKSLFGKIKDGVIRVWAEIEDQQENIEKETTAIQEQTTKPETNDSIEETNEHKKLVLAKEYLTSILKAMNLTNIQMKIEEKADGSVITFEGEGMAVLIGHHGETLDALQYLVALTCNRIDGEYYRITLDCGSYREKREATLQALATRIAQKVKKTGRSQLLEPMNPYERRIIHAVVTDIEGVYSKSKGEEPNRRVVILSESPSKNTSYNKNAKNDDYNKSSNRPKRERTMEEILKADFKKKEDNAQLYSKIEL